MVQTALFIQFMQEKTAAFARLLTIMDELREKCPWDQKQTIETLRPLTIEETYELSEEIVKGDWKGVKEELGDLLLHIVFYAKIGEEQNQWNMAEVINSLCDKLIHRHPHIYGDAVADTEEAVKQNWEKLKMKEGRESVLSGVPSSLPSIIKSYRIQEKAGKIGFEWDNIADVWAKVKEEIGELEVEVAKNDKSKMESEFGDVLFAMVNYARYLDIDPDRSLELSNQKFIKRFQYIEAQAKHINKPLSEMTLGEMDAFWNEAKAKGIA